MNLLELQRARVDLGRLGARAVEFRGGRLSITPLELDAKAVARLREGLPEAIYESRTKTLGLRVEDEPEERLRAVRDLADALTDLLGPSEPIATAATR